MNRARVVAVVSAVLLIAFNPRAALRYYVGERVFRWIMAKTGLGMFATMSLMGAALVVFCAVVSAMVGPR